MGLALGLDFGTSALKAAVIDPQGQCQYHDRIPFRNPTSPVLWEVAVWQLFGQIPRSIINNIHHIGIAGTSGTVLLTDGQGQPIAPTLMYNDNRAGFLLPELKHYVPANHLVLSATSSLIKLFWYQDQGIDLQDKYLLHQVDWLGFLLHGKLGISDEHNSLKLGYDPGINNYPDWFAGLPFAVNYPQVFIPGTPVGTIQPRLAQEFHLPTTCQIHAGTTDSMAAFIASGADQIGDGVTSLGSTLVLKLLSQHRIDDQATGVYSHRLGNLWLVGGASNTGGAVLNHFFSEEELLNFSAQIDPDIVLDLDYYPLLRPGERFPIHDPNLLPRLTPRPDNPVHFLQALLTAMAHIEAQGYQVLKNLGAPKLQRVFTSGGGSGNQTWQTIRQRILGVPVLVSAQQEAAWGVARLAQGDGL
ncbi:carbohydrate kinase FGGY [Gloeomargarita lithophora Alchichica-D10]|uniref:Carbohydrate kinase FGGY n=1 Tax=Gloeomargarita lithophora Alchichica-D10 TaxID=1188229 RepID=A0A1J0AEE0_9CYAN|nr:FGGY-family carbohydrate kinase [Gloeomargarita lithophora]APB34280.1 carbohydrate kinase FGGY [Gloeomargarita lithophora Alchichica-D10]